MPAKQDPHGNPTRNALMLFSILLFSGKAYNLRNLTELLRCSRQSVMRLIEQIEHCGYGNIQKSKRNGQNYYQITPLKTRPKVSLSPQEIEQLVCCREWLRHLLPKNMYAQIEKTAEKSATLLTEYNQREHALQPVATSAVKGGIDYSAHEAWLEILIAAIRQRQVLEIHYQSSKNPQTHAHEFVPMRILAFREGLYVRGHSVTPKGTARPIRPTTLAVHRIQDIYPTQRFVPENIELPNEAESGHFGVAQQCEPFMVLAEIYGSAAIYARERTWGCEQTLEEVPNGVRLHFSAQSEMEVVKWILSFGADAQLLAPAHLRAQDHEELKSALARYINS